MATKVIDGSGLIFGRVAAVTAKQLLSGDSVIITNAEKLVISGRIEASIEKWQTRRSAKNKANPDHSPHWPRRPDLLVKRSIRGMLPWDRTRGRDAFKRLRVYIGVPKGIPKSDGFDSKSLNADKLKAKMHTILELSRRLGWNG